LADLLLLNGQRVLPKRLLEAGFRFEYPDANIALRDLYQRGK
jgi:NAD dependent epimerase/dehydratase family enzyme